MRVYKLHVSKPLRIINSVMLCDCGASATNCEGVSSISGVDLASLAKTVVLEKGVSTAFRQFPCLLFFITEAFLSELTS